VRGIAGELKYAFDSPGGWLIQTIDDQSDWGGYTSLALGEDGYLHISYYDNLCADLMYAFGGPSSAENHVVGPVVPGAVRLDRITPNPSNGDVMIRYQIGDAAFEGKRHVSVQISDIIGRVMSFQATDVFSHGLYSMACDLRSRSGERIPSGVYFVLLEANNPVARDGRRLVVIR